MSDEKQKTEKPDKGVSRRSFLKASGISLGVPLVVGHRIISINGQDVTLYGPTKTPVTLWLNGQKRTAQGEPRVTLLEAVRNVLD